MSTRRERPRLLWIAVFGVAACCAAAATAYGFIQVYGNNFNNRPQYREVKTVTDNNKCKREFKEARKQMQIEATDGPRHCNFKPPVQGSNSQPDYRYDATARILTKTPSAVRPDAYVFLRARVGGGNGYEFRIFPKDKDYELRRKPNGAMFPEAGPNGAIKPMGEANQMRLLFDGGRVRAFANGTEVADITDPSPGQIKGTKVEFGVGNLRNTEKHTIATFDTLKLAVPTP